MAYRDPTAVETAAIALMSAEFTQIIGRFGLHPKVKAAIASAGYITTELFAACYLDDAAIVRDSPAEFGYAVNDVATPANAAAGIAQVRFDAQSTKAESILRQMMR